MVLSIAALLLVFAGVIGAGSMVAVFAYFLHRLRSIESGGGGDSRLLVEQVNRIREELITVQEEMSSLNERFDFTEKLLMSGDSEDESEGSG